MRPILTRWVGALLGVAALTGARAAYATPGEIHLVFWKQDTSIRASMDEFFGCLATASTFGTTWAQEFSISPVVYRGSWVLAAAAPSQAILGSNLDQLMATAFDQGLIPAPTPGYASEYLVYIPPNVTAGDVTGTRICNGSGVCAEHGTSQYKNIQYDLAIAPINCPECGSGLDAASIGGEHEAAEGLADLGTAQYEVGDGCESQNNITSLACCGNMYAIQQLASSVSATDCQTIDATGKQCGCGAPQMSCKTATDCCTGLACELTGGADGGAPELACCNDTGAKCATASDCCGALACSAGKCACVAVDHACVRNADCCSGLSCDMTMHTCVAPSRPRPEATPARP